MKKAFSHSLILLVIITGAFTCASVSAQDDKEDKERLAQLRKELASLNDRLQHYQGEQNRVSNKLRV